MDDLTDLPPQPRRVRRKTGRTWDALSVVLILGILLVSACALLLFLNPYLPINPYPPPTEVARLVLPSVTPTVRILPPTWTPLPTETPLPTPTPMPSGTPQPTLTETPAPPTPTLPASAYKFQLRGDAIQISGDIIHPGEGCKLWIAGQAFDMQGAPIVGITVQLGGTLARSPVYLLSLSGTALQYGPGGYEFTLTDQAVASKGTVWIQLLDQEELPLSPRVSFDTSADCTKNLILINFKQVRK